MIEFDNRLGVDLLLDSSRSPEERALNCERMGFSADLTASVLQALNVGRGQVIFSPQEPQFSIEQTQTS